MKKALVLPVMVVMVMALTTSAATASGWWNIGDAANQDNADPNDPNNGQWAKTATPHRGFSTTTNKCKVCHTAHEAVEDSYRLLRNNSRLSECDWCHDATSGITSLRPYEVGEYAGVRGEHRLGQKIIPDADTDTINNSVATEGLDCGHCHSVHGADSIGFDKNNDGEVDPVALTGKAYTSDDGVDSWDNKLLKVDPSGDGVPLALGTGGLAAAELEGTASANPAAVRTGFCADCHNRNPNWVMTAADDDRPNKRSHPQGPGTDGLMEVFGETSVGVALHLGEAEGCRGCHTASNGSDVPGLSSFPHQSVGWKLLWDTYTSGPATGTGDPQRDLPQMDKVCLYCHPIEDIETYGGYAEVEESACYRCHNIANEAKYGTGAPDVAGQSGKSSSHPTELHSGRHNDNESTDPIGALGAGNRHAECIDCHNMEKAVQGLGRPIRGAWGVSVANGPAGSTPTYTKVDGVAFEYELCFKCHSSYTTRPASNYYESTSGTPIAPQTDKSIEFNPNNNAFHPIEGSGRNQSGALNAQLQAAGLSAASLIKCTDCHNANETGSTSGTAGNSTFEPKGPHGSTVAPVLRANYMTALTPRPVSYDTANFELCFLCHEESRLVMNDDTNFYNNGSRNLNLHRTHLREINNGGGEPGTPYEGKYAEWGWVALCRNCHYNAHGNQEPPNTLYKIGTAAPTGAPPEGTKTHLVSFSPDLAGSGFAKPLWYVNPTTRLRYCRVVCHGASMTTAYDYLPPAAGDDLPSY